MPKRKERRTKFSDANPGLPEEDISQMTYLVTGGAGFVGSRLVERLLEENHDVLIVDDFSTGKSDNLERARKNEKLRIVNGSILDSSLVKSLMNEVVGCFHLAAAVGVRNIVEKPIDSMITNIRGSEIVLEAARNNNVPTLVTSTSEIYGKNPEVPLKEESDRLLGSPLISRWTYSEAKAIEELLAFDLWFSSDIRVNIVRLFNTVGPRQLGDFGMVIPRMISAALRNEDILVHGSGEQTRTFCHVDDAVAGILSVWNSPLTSGIPVNIGGTEEISMKNLAAKIKDLVGSSSKIRLVGYDKVYPNGFEDIPRRVPDTTKIKELTGWKAEKSLEDILVESISEMRARLING